MSDMRADLEGGVGCTGAARGPEDTTGFGQATGAGGTDVTAGPGDKTGPDDRASAQQCTTRGAPQGTIRDMAQGAEHRPRAHRSRRLPLGILPLACLCAMVGALPFFSALWDSFFHDVYGDRSFAGLENYAYLFGDRGFLLSGGITLLWAVASTVLTLVVGYSLAVLLFESKKAFRTLYTVLLIPWGVPAFIAVPLWRMLLHGAGGDSLFSALTGIHVNLLTDPRAAFGAALFVDAWLNVPASVFVIYGALRAIPKSSIEAAIIDGAGRFAMSARVCAPQVAASLVAVAALGFVKAFKEFNVPFLLTAGGPPMLSLITSRSIIGATTTLEVYLYDLFRASDDYGIPAAYAAVLAAIILALVAVATVLRREGPIRRATTTSIRHVEKSPLLQKLRFSPCRLSTLSAHPVAVPEVSPDSTPGFRKHSGLASSEKTAESPTIRNTPPGRIADAGFGIVADALVLAFRLALASLAAISCILLVYALVRTSMSALSSTYIDSFLPRFFTLENFRLIFTEDAIGRAFLNSLGVSLATAILTPCLILPAALALRRFSAGAKSGVFAAIHALGAAGGMHSLIPLYIVFRGVGLLDSYLPIVLVYLYHAVPFALFTTSAFLDKLPREIEDAAELEGASPAARLLRIILPLAAPSVVTSAMVAFLAAWNGFLVPLLFLGDDAMYTVGIRLHSYVGSVASGSPAWNRFAAASIVNLAIIGGLFLRFRSPLGQRVLEDGID